MDARPVEPVPLQGPIDLLQVDLIRVEGRSFEGVARLPLPDPETEGEVWVEALRRFTW